MKKESVPYRALCTEFYDIDKPVAPEDALQCYMRYAKEADGAILEPMCGTGRYLIPLLEAGYDVTGFDYSPHMLDVCRKKCHAKKLKSELVEASFETFSTRDMYNLIYIPCGSFCHLITREQVAKALEFVVNKLNPGGKFVFEVEMLSAIREPQGVWKGRWVGRPDGSKIVLSIVSKFDPSSRVETGLFRYELWEANAITSTEVEEYHVRHYDQAEIEQLLKHHGLKVTGKWQAEPHSGKKASDLDATILYECIKE